jgi:hypothetical protein
MGMSMTDPNELLDRFRTHLSNYSTIDRGADEWVGEVVAAAEAAAELDAHLSAGGDVPAAWDKWEQAKLSVLSGYEPVEVEPLGGPEPGVNGSHLPEDEDTDHES